MNPNGKPSSFSWGLFCLFVCFFGGGVLSGMTGGDGKMKRKREGGFPTDGLLQFDFTVKYFPGIIVGEKNVIEVY